MKISVEKCCHVICLSDTLYPDLLVLSSPGMAFIMFRSKAYTTFCVVDDADDDCNSQAVSSHGRKIRNECVTQKQHNSTYATHISLDSVTRECSQTLLTLLGEISQKLQHNLPAAMIGHIVLSTVCDQVTSLQVALSAMLNQQRSVIDQLNSFRVTSSSGTGSPGLSETKSIEP